MSRKNPIAFVVTGLGRSGTGYTSRLLAALGIPCGHEEVFNLAFPRTTGADLVRDGGPSPWGDSSWLAAPHLGLLPRGAVVLHQLRNPVAVVRSHLGIKFFQQPNAYTSYAVEHVRVVEGDRFDELHLDRLPTAAEKCLRLWADWNRLVERNCKSSGLRRYYYRIEDLGRLESGTLELLLRGVGDPRKRWKVSTLRAALAAVPTDYNSRARDPGISWATLPDGAAKRAVATVAAAYGYTLADLEAA